MCGTPPVAVSRRLPALYIQYSPPETTTAVVHLVGTTSNRDAIGARLKVEGRETRHYWIHNMQGFPGQNSNWLPVSLTGASEGLVSVTWPSGKTTATEVRAGDRVTITE